MSPIIKIGDKAPDFNLPSDNGELINNHKYLGHKLVLYFYPKDDTSGCTQEALEFNALRDEFKKSDTFIIGVSPDNIKKHSKFKSKYDLNFPLLADEDKILLSAYGVWVEKSMYGRKYMGVERTTVLIDKNGSVSHIWSKVKVPGHAAEVLHAAQNI
jgi:thioredoxin-dependent peroxiredoxin